MYIYRNNQHFLLHIIIDFFYCKIIHISEIRILYIQNDILNSIDQSKVVLLVLLDLSAAFDTIYHELLINRLSSRLGLSGCVLDWFRSYLKNRSQRVKLDNVLSDHTLLRYGVPQGSVLCPILFSIYVLPLCYIIKKIWDKLSHIY